MEDKDQTDLAKELQVVKQNQQALYAEQQKLNKQTEQLLEAVAVEGPKLIREWIKANKETTLKDSENYRVVQTKELETIAKIDHREKTNRSLLIALSVIVLGILAAMDKVSAIAPVMGVLIGALATFNPTYNIFSRKSSSVSKDVSEDS